MDERDAESETTSDAATPHDKPLPEPTSPPNRKRHWGLILFGALVVLPIVLFVLWTAAALNWSYSIGQRAGFVQKFSEKGWLCKTW